MVINKIKISRYNIAITFIIVIMFSLGMAHIANRYMFIDESVEAMIGKNILKYFIPKAWDGTNLVMAGLNGNEFNQNLIPIRNNWLPYYIAALGLKISLLFNLGTQTSVGVMRSFFVVIGICGAISFYHLTKELTENKVITLFSLLFFAFSIPILLYIRAVYYISPTLTFTITTILFYIKYIKNQKTKTLVMLVISSVLLFHSFYPYFFITVFALAVTYMIFDFNKKTFKKLLVCFIPIALLTIPWLIYIRLYLSNVEKNVFVTPNIFAQSILGYLWQIHAYFFPFIPIVLLVLIIMLVKKVNYNKNENIVIKQIGINHKIVKFIQERHKYRTFFLLFIQISTNIIIISLVNNFLDTRRLISAIPFLYIIMAYLLFYLYSNIRYLGIFILTLCLFTNTLHVFPYLILKKSNINTIEKIVKPPVPFFNADKNWKNKKADLQTYLSKMCRIESYTIYYLEEILNTYDDADKGIVEFLRKHAKHGDKVYLAGYQYETIAFYTGLQVVNRLDPSNDPLPSAYKYYPNATTFEDLTKYPIENCDWIIERAVLSYTAGDNAIWHNNKNFERIYIDYPDAKPWNEIWDHSFFTDRSFAGVYIYRNKMTTNSIN